MTIVTTFLATIGLIAPGFMAMAGRLSDPDGSITALRQNYSLFCRVQA